MAMVIMFLLVAMVIMVATVIVVMLVIVVMVVILFMVVVVSMVVMVRTGQDEYRQIWLTDHARALPNGIMASHSVPYMQA